MAQKPMAVLDGPPGPDGPLDLPPWSERDAIDAICLEHFGHPAKKQQLDVAEKIVKGEDCILVAGCGWGKTLTFVLPLLYLPDRVIVIVSPLKILADEQKKTMESKGISSIVIKKETIATRTEVADLAAGKYRAVFLSPEIMFSSPRLFKLWNKPGWKERLMAVILDEAHCVCTWGQNFRKDYAKIGTLRAKVRPDVSFVSLSATLTPAFLVSLKKLLFYQDDVSLINIGNNRPNIHLIVKTLRHPANSYRDLDFVLDFKKTIVYFQTRDQASEAGEYLLWRAKDEDQEKIGVFHSIYSGVYKSDAMQEFIDGNISLLVATEAAGMGCDIRDIERVVQYLPPKDLTTLIQRIGRVARDPNSLGLGILLVPETMDDSKFDPDLVEYIRTQDCRRDVLDRVFNNTPSKLQDHQPCCDYSHPIDLFDAVLDQEGHSNTTSTKRTPSRTKDEKKRALSVIEDWSERTYYRDVASHNRYFTVNTLIPPIVVNTLQAKFAKITSPDTIQSVARWEPINKQYVQELGAALVELNTEIAAERSVNTQRRVHSRKSRTTLRYDTRVDLTSFTKQPQQLEQLSSHQQPKFTNLHHEHRQGSDRQQQEVDDRQQESQCSNSDKQQQPTQKQRQPRPRSKNQRKQSTEKDSQHDPSQSLTFSNQPLKDITNSTLTPLSISSQPRARQLRFTNLDASHFNKK